MRKLLSGPNLEPLAEGENGEWPEVNKTCREVDDGCRGAGLDDRGMSIEEPTIDGGMGGLPKIGEV